MNANKLENILPTPPVLDTREPALDTLVQQCPRLKPIVDRLKAGRDREDEILKEGYLPARSEELRRQNRREMADDVARLKAEGDQEIDTEEETANAVAARTAAQIATPPRTP